MKKSFIAVLAKITILFLVFAVGIPAAHAKLSERQRHAVTKDGKQVYFAIMQQAATIQQLRAQQPLRGEKIDFKSLAARQIKASLINEHRLKIAAAGIKPKNVLYHYTNALNGFAALMTAAQANDLARQPGVASVQLDQMRYKHTENSPTFMKLTVRRGPWDQGIKGEDVIVGVIDTGIWPEHPSFADDGTYAPLPIDLDDSERSPCDFGNIDHNPDDVPFECNNKLIGARQFLDAYIAVIGLLDEEFDSARDDDGHGTHTASTSAGNADVDASIFGIPRGKVSGIAPRARVIAYKGLGLQGGFGSDLAAAIDQAVADGVDVINYSIGGGASLIGADDIAYLFAAQAGVFVATSAGNSGPDPETIGGPASVPWVTTIGASSQNRTFISDITLNGPGKPPKKLWGGSVTPGINNFNLVDAEGIADITGDTSGTCSNPFPAATFQEDDCVVCNMTDSGRNRTGRATNVAAAGGGAVLYHNSAVMNNTPSDNNPLPTVHVLNEVGNPLKAYLSDHPGQVTISFTQSVARKSPRDRRVVPNMMAYFSSRGPDPVAMDIIKPDVTAPGLLILAGASPIHLNTAAQDQLFQAIQGTSMSGPHAAGALALIKQAHPDWSPAMAKSALMTTARQNIIKDDGETKADPFDMGAGHIKPGGRVVAGSAYQPGLTYDAGYLEYLGFLCDAAPQVFADPEGFCASLEEAGIPTQAINLNLPSIGISELPGSQTIQRTVTSVAENPGTIVYRAIVDAPKGYRVEVTPRKLRLDQGESKTYRVTITNKRAVIGEWAFGSLKWVAVKGSKKKYKVYSPIAVRASLFNAPAEVLGQGVDGSADFDIAFGYSGDYAAAAHGLNPATTTVDNVPQDPDQAFDPDDGFSNLHEVTLSGAAHFRVAIPPEATEPDADLDVYVFDPTGALVAQSTKGATDELVTIEQPMDGTWQVFVHGWSTPGGDSDYTMYSWVVSATPGGNLVIDYAPTSAILGAKEAIGVSWMGAIDNWYIGAVSHNRDSELIGLTLINVDNRP